MSIFVDKQRLLTSSDTLSGGVNLFRNTDKLDKFWSAFASDWGQAEKSANFASTVNHELIATKSVFHAANDSAMHATICCSQQIHLETGVYTVSFVARNNRTNPPGFSLELFSDYTDKHGGAPLGSTRTNLTNIWQRYSITFRITEAGTYGNWRILHNADTQVAGGSLYYANLKLERGSIATEWCPNYADYYDDLQNQINELKKQIPGR